MKAVRILVIVLILAGIGGGAYFYVKIHRPMAEEHTRMKIGEPERDRAMAELKKYKEREQWVPAAAESLKAGLKEEIEAGKAEVVAAGDRIIVNIKEEALYTPDSVTFSKESTPTREKLASLLKDLKDMKDGEIYVGNATHPVAAQRKGGARIPARSAVDIAADRSLALVKYFEAKGVPQESLIAVAYPAKLPDRGFRINGDKTVIVVASPPAIAPEPAAARPAASPQQPKPAQEQKTAPPAPPAGPRPEQPKPVPIQPAPPKAQ